MKTGCFFTYFGPGRISVARWAPRNIPSGYQIYKQLQPGEYFNKVSEDEYRILYGRQLAKLSPEKVWRDLHEYTPGSEPVLLCWERVDRGEFCHRRLVADWFRLTLGEQVHELGTQEQE